MNQSGTRRFAWWGWVGLWVVMFAVGVSLVGPLLRIYGASEPPKSLLFEEVYKLIKERYVEPKKTDDGQLMEGAIRGMVDTLDRHSTFLDLQARRELNVETTGSFGGLGIEVTVEGGQLQVVSPIEDTPAFRAGIQSGDFIGQIDGESTEDWSVEKAITKLRGQIGSKVVLTIVRTGVADPFDVSLTRDVIKIQTVKAHLIKPDIGYIRLRNFAETSGDDVKKAIGDLLNKGAKSLVLDLRNNPGGLLHVSVEIASQFLPPGKLVVSTKGRSPQMNSEMYSTGGVMSDGQVAVVVLVNKGSASASEIVTGALKDHGRGIIVGSKTFGKGSVQSIFELPGGAGLKLTTAHYYTPNGILIHEKGIEPDSQVAERTGGKATIELIRKDALSGFGEAYGKKHAADLKVPFIVTDQTWEEFLQFARDRGASVVREDVEKDREWIVRQIKFEVLRKIKGRDAADLASLQEDDDAVRRALELIKVSAILKFNKQEKEIGK